MKKLIECYQEYQSIIDSYRGDKTDWESAYSRLKKLNNKISEIRIVSSKNFLFYAWVKRALHNEVREEQHRVEMIVLCKG